LKGASINTKQCSFSSDASWIAVACCGDDVARIWDMKTFKCISTLNHDAPVDACAVSANGMIATADFGWNKTGTLRLWY